MWGMRGQDYLLTRGVALRLSDYLRELKLALQLRCWAGVWVRPCASDLWVSSGLAVSFTCFSRPARFSGRIVRSTGDLSRREGRLNLGVWLPAFSPERRGRGFVGPVPVAG